MDSKITLAVSQLAASQRRVISRPQALDCGMTPKQIVHAVRSGRWQPLHPGVYLTHTGRVDWHVRAWAALLRAGPGASLSHASAAYLWGLETSAPSMLRVATPGQRTIVRPPGTRVTRRRSVEVVKRQGYRLTSVRQTDLDLTAEPGYTLDETAALLGRAAQRDLLKPTHLLEALDGYWHHPMADQLRRACADAADGVESSLESRILRSVIREHGLAGFALQVPLDAPAGTASEPSGSGASGPGAFAPQSTASGPVVTDPEPGAADAQRHVERNDLRNVALGIRIEADGVAWHRNTFHEDRRRDRKAAAAGEPDSPGDLGGGGAAV